MMRYSIAEKNASAKQTIELKKNLTIRLISPEDGNWYYILQESSKSVREKLNVVKQQQPKLTRVSSI